MMKNKYGMLALFLSGALFASKSKYGNEDLYQQRMSVVLYEYQKKMVNKNTKKKEEKDPYIAVCKYNGEGSIFVQGINNLSDTFKSVCYFYNKKSMIIKCATLASSAWVKPGGVNFTSKNSEYYGYTDRDYNGREYSLWVDYANKENPFVFINARQHNSVKKTLFSPQANRFLVLRQHNTIVYDKTGQQKFEWHRSGKNSIFVGEEHLAEVVPNSSLVNIFRIENEPRETPLNQGESFTAEEVLLSHDGKMFAVGATCQDKNYAFTKITFYDAETLQEKRKLYVPGWPFTGNRTEQHKFMQFSSDDKRFFIHTKTLQEGVISWFFDIDCNNNFMRIKHEENTSKLYNLVQDKYFGTIGSNIVKIFDIRKPTEKPEPLHLPYVTHCALNPDSGSLIKGIFATEKGIKLYYYTGGTSEKGWE